MKLFRGCVPLIALVALLLPAAGTAHAATAPSLPAGVHVDPGSPAAKEYAIPLAQARGGAAGGGSGSGQLFGSGITPAPSTSTTSSSTTGGTTSAAVATKPRPRGHHGSGPRQRASSKPQVRDVTAAPAAELSGSARPAGGGAGVAWMLGVAALVLALGGLGGAVLARYSRGTSTRTS